MESVLLIVTAIGVFGVFVQIHRGTKIQRAIFLKELYTELSSDPDASEAFYAIEYDELTYDDDFHGSEMEPKLDRYLVLLDVICEMYDQGILRWEEMRFFAHYLDRTAKNKQVRTYIEFLNTFQKELGTAHRPFPALQKQLPKYRFGGSNKYQTTELAKYAS